ncbi:unnamed protein product [Lactuca virosa]|uniref:RRM domain-containing protein n=1 Tax=Lactuca virosa TaxID=75947 RepID=A0AAU9MHS6_9ASTR|nr:unnamed protein product [Lactuca virosa]
MKPDIEHFKVFGCIGYVHVHRQGRTRLDERRHMCIFLGERKNGRKFAFVRFRNVVDVKEFEGRLNGIKFQNVQLVVNLEKNKRKPPEMTHGLRNKESRTMNSKSVAQWGMRDHISFAEVIKPTRQEPKPRNIPTPIMMSKVQYMNKYWTRNTIVIGEAISLTHLSNLPSLLTIMEGEDVEVKYVGGLYVLLEFHNSVNAKTFINMSSRWKDLLKWVKLGDEAELRFERVAWIRLVGFSLKLWDDKNFVAIANSFGKIIWPCDEFPHHVDMSFPKIGILTTIRKCINEEITEDEDDDDEDGVFYTWLPNNDEDIEDGEIDPNSEELRSDVVPTPSKKPANNNELTIRETNQVCESPAMEPLVKEDQKSQRIGNHNKSEDVQAP